MVFRWIINIDVLICNIKISSNYNRLLSFELLEVFSEVDIPLLCSVVGPFEVYTDVRHINTHYIEGGVFECDCAAFLIVFGEAEIVLN